jgi:hypothetical protein
MPDNKRAADSGLSLVDARLTPPLTRPDGGVGGMKGLGCDNLIGPQTNIQDLAWCSWSHRGHERQLGRMMLSIY